MPAIEGGKLDVPREEPLKRELEDFVAAIADGRAPTVTGEQGRAALALAERVYEGDADVDSNSLEVIIGRLRKKIGATLIDTVRGRGYRLASPTPSAA